MREQTTTKIERFKQKVINIRTDEDFIENNLIDLPFIYYYKTKDEPPTSVEYEWISSDKKKKKIEVRASKLGVPTSYDNDVLLALFRIYIRQCDDKIICNNDINDNSIDNTVHFSYRELISELGYKDFSFKLKERVDISIERLCDTNIYNTGGGIYNPLTKEYITDCKFQVGILHNYSAYSYVSTIDKNGEEKKVLDKKSLKDRVSVKIDMFFLKNLLQGKGKISKKSLRLSLKIDISRRLYLILNKWRNGRSITFFKYDTLYNRIPLPLNEKEKKTDYYRKRRLKDACSELKEINFIYNFNFNKEGVTFRFEESGDNEIALTLDSNLLSKYNTYDEILNKLIEYKIDEKTLKKYFKLYQIPYYQALLRFVEDRIYLIENPASYIFQGLVTPYENIDKKYYN